MGNKRERAKTKRNQKRPEVEGGKEVDSRRGERAWKGLGLIDGDNGGEP